MAPRLTRTPMTTRGRRGTRSTSPPCSTGSSRICAGCWALRHSTSPASNRRNAWPPISTWRCGGSVPRPLLRQVLDATYHQVWWPATEEVRYAGDHLPVWDEDSGNYLDPATGEVLQTWEDAMDAIGPADQPRHVARFGPKFDAQGVLAGSKEAERCIGYLTKYLTKQVADCHVPETEAQRAHADRL